MIVYPFLGTFKVTCLFGINSDTETYAVKGHKGLDIVGISDKTVVSVNDGTVADINSHGSAYGNHVWVAHGDGTGALYAHLSSISVRKGQKVSAKDKIGVMGSSGNSTGPHLHLEIHSSGQYAYGKNLVDPALYLNLSGGNLKGKTFEGTGYVSMNSYTQVGNSITPAATNVGYTEALVPSGESYKIEGIGTASRDWLYGRRYRILVEVSAGQYLEVSEMRCAFEIVKTAFMEPNQSIVTLYNLSPNTENTIIKEGSSVIIEAGYNGSQYGKIFEGNILQPLRSKENGTDYVLKLVSMDSDRYLAYGLVGVSLVAAQSARDAVTACASKASIQAEIGQLDLNEVKYPRGKVLFGAPKDYLKQIAQTNNSTFYMNNGEINIVAAKGVPKGEIIELSPDSGLIGSPQQTELGINFVSLLNPLLDINSLIRIDSSKIAGYQYQPGKPVRSLDREGIYRIIKITHEGDTRGDDWYSRCEAISQTGLLPNMMTSDAISPW